MKRAYFHFVLALGNRIVDFGTWVHGLARQRSYRHRRLKMRGIHGVVGDEYRRFDSYRELRAARDAEEIAALERMAGK